MIGSFDFCAICLGLTHDQKQRCKRAYFHAEMRHAITWIPAREHRSSPIVCVILSRPAQEGTADPFFQLLKCWILRRVFFFPKFVTVFQLDSSVESARLRDGWCRETSGVCPVEGWHLRRPTAVLRWVHVIHTLTKLHMHSHATHALTAELMHTSHHTTHAQFYELGSSFDKAAKKKPTAFSKVIHTTRTHAHTYPRTHIPAHTMCFLTDVFARQDDSTQDHQRSATVLILPQHPALEPITLVPGVLGRQVRKDR